MLVADTSKSQGCVIKNTLTRDLISGKQGTKQAQLLSVQLRAN